MHLNNGEINGSLYMNTSTDVLYTPAFPKLLLWSFATQSVVCGPAALESTGKKLEMKNLGPHPRPTESEFTF